MARFPRRYREGQEEICALTSRKDATGLDRSVERPHALETVIHVGSAMSSVRLARNRGIDCAKMVVEFRLRAVGAVAY